jgi:hypothetical protein
MKPKKLVLVTGDSSGGKTLLSRFIAEHTCLTTNSSALVIDADEKPGLSKMTKAGQGVTRHRLRHREDLRAINQLMNGKTLGWVDIMGSAREFVSESFRDIADMADAGIFVIPIILIGDRGSAVSEAVQWLKYFASLPTCYIVHNPKTNISEEQKTEFKKRTDQLKGPKNRPILTLPPLDAPVAIELERIGCPLSEIIDGKIKCIDSDLLADSLTMIDVRTWQRKMLIATQPLLDEVNASLLLESGNKA